MWFNVLSVVLGGLITILTAIAVETLRRPKLKLRLCDPKDNDYRGQERPAQTARFINLVLENKPLPCCAVWMSRSAAVQCHGMISFHHLDGQNVFGRSMSIRWHGTPEPVPVQLAVGNQTWLMYDPGWNSQRVDIQPAEHRILNVAVRFDSEDECYGWSNENYFSNPIWRNRQWALPKGRYLVKVTVISAGERCLGVFRLVNDVPVSDFRLVEAQEGDRPVD
jgi:hypothetical protein